MQSLLDGKSKVSIIKAAEKDKLQARLNPKEDVKKSRSIGEVRKAMYGNDGKEA